MQRGDPARMAGVPGLQEIERFGAAHFAHDDAIRAQTHRRANEIAE
jgi:hypothetical protein